MQNNNTAEKTVDKDSQKICELVHTVRALHGQLDLDIPSGQRAHIDPTAQGILREPTNLQLVKKLIGYIRQGNAKAKDLAQQLEACLPPPVSDEQSPLQDVTATPKDASAANDMAPAGNTEKQNRAYILVKIDEITTAAPFNTLFVVRPETLEAITADMLLNGYNEAYPIIAWRERKTAVDGHTRLLAAKIAGLSEVPVAYRSFESEDAALEFAVRNQRDRRNLTDVDYFHLAKELDKRGKHGGDRKSAHAEIKTSANGLKSSAEETAQKLGTSPTKVEKIRRVLDSGKKDLINAVESGEKTINKAVTELRTSLPSNKASAPAKLLKPLRKKVKSIARQLRAGYQDLATLADQLVAGIEAVLKAEQKKEKVS